MRAVTLPVCACLTWDRIGSGNAFGAYYYLSKLKTIHLAQQGTSRVWVEGDAGPNDPPGPRRAVYGSAFFPSYLFGGGLGRGKLEGGPRRAKQVIGRLANGTALGSLGDIKL